MSLYDLRYTHTELAQAARDGRPCPDEDAAPDHLLAFDGALLQEWLVLR